MTLLVNLAEIQLSEVQLGLARKVALDEAAKASEGTLTLLHLIDAMDKHHELSLFSSELRKAAIPGRWVHYLQSDTL